MDKNALTRIATLAGSAILSLVLAPMATAEGKPLRTPSGQAMPNDAPPTGQPAAIALRPAKLGGLPAQWEAEGPAGPAVRNVVDPTLTPFLPKPGTGTGVAVIVAPGGGFRILAIESEGFAVARWLADHGIAAFVLQYRTVPGPRDQNEFYRTMMASMARDIKEAKPLEATPEALEDAQSAVRLVRANATKWAIDSARVGFVGFSAGAMTALSVGLGEKSTRPDFIAPIYPPMGPRPVPADAPPMFTAIALDDPLFAIGKPMALIQAWRDARRPVEAHLYEGGGHGFGMANRSAASALWIDQFHAWMKDRKIIPVTK